MANFLVEVLNTRDNTSLDELRCALNKVNERLKHLKNELVLSLQSAFGTFDSDIGKVSSWFIDVLEINDEAVNLHEKLENESLTAVLSEEEFLFVRSELDSCDMSIDLLKGLVDIIKNLENTEPSDPYNASQRLLNAKSGLKGLIQEYFEEEKSEWITGLQFAITSKIGETFEFALKEWNSKIHFEQNTLVIDPNSGKEDIGSIIEALSNLNCFSKVRERFFNQVWTELLSKAATPDYKVKIINPNQSAKSNLIVSQKKDDSNESDPLIESPNSLPLSTITKYGSNDTVLIHVKKLDTPINDLTTLFKSILHLIECLHNIFSDNTKVMSDMGDALGQKLVNQLLSKSFKYLVLQQSGGCKKTAASNVALIPIFAEDLAKFDFKIPDRSRFDEFEKNFESLFVSQVREDVIARIEELIKSDIHHTVETEPEMLAEYFDSNNEELIAQSPYIQDSFTISRSILNMVEILQQHLVSYPDDNELVSRAYDLFELLVTIPKFGTESKDFIPLSAVLIHNNCMFLMLYAESVFPMCVDMIPHLHAKGTKAFTFMMKSIRSRLNEMIESALSGLDIETDLYPEERKIKFLAIAAELEKLDRIFKTVLPSNPWRSALATLIDHTVNEICTKVLTFEDISAKIGNGLADSFTKFAVETSKLFKKEGQSTREVDVVTSKLVPKWERFRMLTFVITASLKDIDDKWVNGCGPLSMAFSPEELRKLIRALFANTDRRAAFLSSIK